MIDAIFCKFESVILGFIQTNNVSDTEVTEYLQVVFRLITASIRSNLVNRAHESNELARNNPVKISIFYTLIIFVLFVVEFSEIVPSVTDTNFQTL